MYKIIRRGRRLVHPVSAIDLTLANREPDRVCCSTLSHNALVKTTKQRKKFSTDKRKEESMIIYVLCIRRAKLMMERNKKLRQNGKILKVLLQQIPHI